MQEKTKRSKHLLWVAAENGALDGGKVGGIGDVVHQLPRALVEYDCRIDIATPSHGFLHHTDGAVHFGRTGFLFRGYPHDAEIFAVPPRHPHTGIRHLVFHHPILASFDPLGRKYRIYTHDPPDRPYFSDATRFAFFCKAVAAAVSQNLIEDIDAIHLHDWHAAYVAVLRKFHPEHGDLERIRTVYSIHNLAFQGIRPLRGSESSLEAWFPEMVYDWFSVADPRWPDTVNPAAAAIRLCDAVHTVSPSYAAEIQKPSRKPRYFGGEGLEADLGRAAEDGRLIGILNGCPEPPEPGVAPAGLNELLDMARARVIRWSGRREPVASAQFVAYARLLELERRPSDPAILLTSVCRVGEQKMLIPRASGSDGRSGLEKVLTGLGDAGLLVLLGEGDPEYERRTAT
jgi:starch synthase